MKSIINKYNKALKKIKYGERKKRKQFVDDLQYYNMMYNNPYYPYYGSAGAAPSLYPRPF